LRRNKWTVWGRLFQARMWREYARDWDRQGLPRDWVEQILRKSKEECLRRCRVNIYLAKRLNRINHPNLEEKVDVAIAAE